MRERGSLLLEMCLVVGLLVGIVFVFHLKVIRIAMDTLNRLQERRLRYDGVILWKP